MHQLKFLHVADVHLGRPFSGLDHLCPDAAQIVRAAGSTAWERVVRLALQEKVHFVVLAGDIFDSAEPTIRARLAFRDGIDCLRQSGVPVFMASGNHDPLGALPESLLALPGLHVFEPEPHGLRRGAVELTEGVVVYGAGYRSSAVTENLAKRFRRDLGIEVAVGVLHANVGCRQGHHNYAPCTVPDLIATGMDVWSLGHVHAPGVVEAQPLIVYAGTTQGATRKELGPRGAYVITTGGSEGATAELRPVAPVEWLDISLDVTDIGSLDELVEAACVSCRSLIAEKSNLEAILVHLTLVGRTGRLRPPGPRDREEVLSLLGERLARDSIPIFPVSLHDATMPLVDLESFQEEQGFIGDLLRECRAVCASPDLLRQVADEVCSELAERVGRSLLPEELFPEHLRASPQSLAPFLEEAANRVCAMLADKR